MTNTREEQGVLFEVAAPKADAEDRTARARRQNRERQMRWRRRYQFAAPAYDGADWATVTTCSGS